MKKKILFISHEASLTGAPLVLLYFMEWLHEHHPEKYEIGILHLKGGEREDRFNQIAVKVFYLQPSKFQRIAFKVVNKITSGKIFKYVKSPVEKGVEKIAAYNYDLIYANTIAVLPVATEIKKKSNANTKLLAHVHEMQASLKAYIKNPAEITPHLNHIIAASNAVKSSILYEWDVKSDLIDVVYEFSKVKIVTSKKGVNLNRFVVGASGGVTPRKGPDLFVQVARYIKEHFKEVTIDFIWVGKISDKERMIIEEDLKKLGLLDCVSFVGLQTNPHKYFSTFDVFLMTSREDPFPLVCIEVGMLGKPIICFDKATGTQEILEKGGGKIVPYLSIERMSEEVVNYYHNPEQLAQDAAIVKKNFNNFTPEVLCPEIFSILISL